MVCALGAERRRGGHWQDVVSTAVFLHSCCLLRGRVGLVLMMRSSMACAIREAYATTLTVVILIEEQADGMD